MKPLLFILVALVVVGCGQPEEIQEAPLPSKPLKTADDYYDEAVAIYNRGIPDDSSGDWFSVVYAEGVLQKLDSCIAKDSSVSKYYALRSDVSYDIYGYKGGMEDINKAIALDSTIAWCWKRRGIMQLEWGDTLHACNDFNMALALGDSAAKVVKHYSCYSKRIDQSLTSIMQEIGCSQ